MNQCHPLDRQWMTFDPVTGVVEGATVTERRLSQLSGVFADDAAYRRMLAEKDPIVYRVFSMEFGAGPGDLHYGIGVLMPGKVGDEYFMTKGHYHEWRDAAEIYTCLRGQGMMLLEDEPTGDTRLLPFCANQIVHVPGFTAHRTINTGIEPLIYMGVYPARAGHDYGAIAARNFLGMVVERDSRPTLLDRSGYSVNREETAP